MKTLDEIKNYLANALNQLNLASPELDALSAFLANGIYLDQSLATSIVTESNPATCVLLNSAIKHALSKMYSVFRGKNFKVRVVDGIRPNKSFKAYKYDTFAELNGYKLVYAKEYDFHVGEDITATKTSGIDLILCKEVRTGAFLGQGSYKFNILESDISEDIAIYKPNSAVTTDTSSSFDSNYEQTIYSDIDEMTHDEVIKTDNQMHGKDKILVITDVDFSVTLFNSNKFNDDTYYYYRYLPYLSIEDMSNLMSDINENLDSLDKVKALLKKFKYFENFDITGDELVIYEGESEYDISGAKSQSSLPLDRESNIDNIFWLSSVKFTGNDMIRSTNDVLDKFKTTFNGRYENAVAYEESDNDTGYVKKIIIYYIPKVNGAPITTSDIDRFKSSINKMQYNSLVEIEISESTPTRQIYVIFLNVKASKDVTGEIHDVLLNESYSMLSGNPSYNNYDPMKVIGELQKINGVISISFDLDRMTSPPYTPESFVNALQPSQTTIGSYYNLTDSIQCTYVD